MQRREEGGVTSRDHIELDRENFERVQKQGEREKEVIFVAESRKSTKHFFN